MLAPKYQDIGRTKVALLSSHDGGALVRVIAGDVAGHLGPGATHTPITLIHASITPGAAADDPVAGRLQRARLCVVRPGTAGADGQPIEMGQLAVYEGFGATQAETITLAASKTQDSRSPNMEVIILGGKPIGEPVEHYGPFVMNTKAELAQAFEDFQAGRLGTIPAGHH